MTQKLKDFCKLSGGDQSGKISLAFHGGREAAICGADAAAVPVAHEVPPDQSIQFLNGQALGVESAVEELALHPGPHTLTAGVVMAVPAVAVHALANAILLGRRPVRLCDAVGPALRAVDQTDPVHHPADGLNGEKVVYNLPKENTLCSI